MHVLGVAKHALYFFRVFYDSELAFRFMKKFLNVHMGGGTNNIVYKKGTAFNE